MAEDENIEEDNGADGVGDAYGDMEEIVPLSGMYESWFLDYASYVILERAVPALEDGLKPVQRRILHSMKELDDGRYNKVANIIGNTMKYHPHGDASIGDALVQIGQKDIAVDCQGNWGNTLTGDSAAAPRYIEARLSKFAVDVMFNHKTTEWLASYDGRNKEPVHLPIKFPLLLAQGAEGIAVGLACKMLPHNFNELIDNSIKVLKGRRTNILPDFPNGGTMDAENYNDGLRGGKIRVRAKIKQVDKKTLMINEIPYGSTTSSLIESIIKANDKGKIKIKKIEDNTAAEAEIIVHLHAGVSPDKTIDALFAFTDCETPISPNACVIVGEKPVFMGVNEMLKLSTERTVELLKLELEIRKKELEEQWHFASLEQIFIENRIYRDIEEEETWEGVIEAIDKGLHKYISTPSRKSKAKSVLQLMRDVTEDDIKRLTEIRIKRISKFDSDRAMDHIAKLEDEIKAVKHDLDNLTEYAINYFKELKTKYGEGRDRKTEIRTFDTISKTKVVVSNKKLYVNREEGFVGFGLRGSEQIQECSDIDDIIVIRRDGVMKVVKIADKVFVGKDIMAARVWKKGDERTIYHLIYKDGTRGNTYVKRFSVTSITRDKEYDLTKGTEGSKVLYLSINPNGEAEIVNVILRARPNLKKLRFEYDFSELAIKGRGVQGNILTKHAVSKIEQREVGGSTLAARKVWFDDVTQRLNDDERGELVGEFQGDDKMLIIHQDGSYELLPPKLSTRFDEDMIHLEKFNPKKPLNVVYFDGEKGWYMIKRFLPEPVGKRTLFISEHEKSYLECALTDLKPRINVVYDGRSSSKEAEEINVWEFIDLKGMKAKGNKLTDEKVKNIDILDSIEPTKEELAEIEHVTNTGEEQNLVEETAEESKQDSQADEKKKPAKKSEPEDSSKIDEKGQAELF